ncbi:calmodulin-like protein 6 [Anopheles sinensis]|uniref:Calmodulin-like protein 6 n=1 Tax=Anopheles sinensis TaxID=74873 RepID=A0A084WAR5_ANOSI|nr:calmodulin-like protein 6 [Anopheles sinensis]
MIGIGSYHSDDGHTTPRTILRLIDGAILQRHRSKSPQPANDLALDGTQEQNRKSEELETLEDGDGDGVIRAKRNERSKEPCVNLRWDGLEKGAPTNDRKVLTFAVHEPLVDDGNSSPSSKSDSEWEMETVWLGIKSDYASAVVAFAIVKRKCCSIAGVRPVRMDGSQKERPFLLTKRLDKWASIKRNYRYVAGYHLRAGR